MYEPPGRLDSFFIPINFPGDVDTVGISVREAATRLSINKNALQDRLKRNTIEYMTVNGRAFITDRAIAHLWHSDRRRKSKEVAYYACYLIAEVSKKKNIDEIKTDAKLQEKKNFNELFLKAYSHESLSRIIDLQHNVYIEFDFELINPSLFKGKHTPIEYYINDSFYINFIPTKTSDIYQFFACQIYEDKGKKRLDTCGVGERNQSWKDYIINKFNNNAINISDLKIIL